ncbi:MAG: 2-oxoglutarate oxidoreductase [Euryarchaeota archaeon]|jgi:2-oxoglutarate ferredoxin oxidoreductase subunit beta|nr:2-oxoglutarate oxidoreductase [Euryarchaeota archaeon]MDP6363481.1 thiamine pyrophosphate-dependent enzyme [Candidatus Poseidoniia archaeon]MDP6846648.1 thiamine pyrophosphate-dependent enzyme [Candidatus Poseidoniia archaeon]MDP7006776.1 thiamine pyrophosphate-dependent enzyme [Candidatus Poseidoniia archaeon]|tara:strand:- start:636 stop:1565 length:930 start_codon:yes stop_codon:yes gene_type:complete
MADYAYSGFTHDPSGSLPTPEPPAGFTARHGPDQGIVQPFKTHYCPGCEHGTLTRAIGNEIVRRGELDRSIMIVSVGCSVLAYDYLDIDAIQAAHGRSPAVATGIKRLLPDHTIFMVQGDGDAAAIGLSETLQAAHRGEAITIFMVNNGIYGMTGGQIAPTTPIGSKTSTSPEGRTIDLHGHPVDTCALVSQTPGAAYVRRASITIAPPRKEVDQETPRGEARGFIARPAIKAEKAVREAFEVQERGGFAFVEFISTCNINWGMKVLESKVHAHEVMLPAFPVGLFVDRLGVSGKTVDPRPATHPREEG